MDELPAFDNRGFYVPVPGLSMLSPAIPDSIKRRLPRILSRQLQRLLVAPDAPSSTQNDQLPDLQDSLGGETPPISEPDLQNDSHMSDCSCDDLQRPATMASCDTDFSRSTRSSYHSDSVTLVDVTRMEDFMTPMIPKYEVDSGVRWNRVIPALSLLRNAVYEAQQPHCDGRLVRSLYTGALGYLLDALPQDMTPEEISRIQENLPDQMDSSERQSGLYAQGPWRQSPAGRSFLHRFLASMIVKLFIVFQLLAPYLKTIVRQVYQWERSHRVTERVLALAMCVIELTGRYGYNLGSFIFGLRDGKTTTAFLEIVSSWLEAILGGVYEGVGEGMLMVGVHPAPAQRPGR